MTFNFLGPGLTVNVEAKVKEQIILDSSGVLCMIVHEEPGRTHQKLSNEPRYRSPFIGDLTRGTF